MFSLAGGRLLPAIAITLVACVGPSLERSVPKAVAIVLPELTPMEHEAIATGNKEKGRPLQTGIGRDVPSSQRDVPLASLSWSGSESAQVSEISVQSPGASSLRLGLQLLGGPSCIGLAMQFLGADGQRSDIVKESVVRSAPDTWWSPITRGERTSVILTLPIRSVPEDCVVRVARISHIY